VWVTVILATLCAAVVCAGPGGNARRNRVDFNRDVRPILSQHCFKCHGPDDRQRMAGLRLDTRAGAVAVLKSGKRAVVPGRPERSELARRIFLNGPLQMPPAHANKPLSETKKQILRRWIAEGAVYQPHWAFVPPRPVSLPIPPSSPPRKGGLGGIWKTWPRNPIDYFVLARLEKEGLKPSPEADRYTLARRVYLDLIGLPPTPEEADAFVNDRSPDAYEKLVDRLLASPHYGERWARRWLDLARYADTNGYEKDRPRSIWPYRDWVIAALNADMPFDRFTIEQLAGDMLPNATLDQRIATGFHRNTMLNEEGGIDPLEFRFHAMTDRVATTGTVWLGLTMGCAQCHTHKFDPITQKEYYRFMAFLDNADEPEIEIPKPDVVARRQEIEAQAAEREAKLVEKFPAADGLSGPANLERRFREWVGQQEQRAVRWTILRPAKATANMPLLTVLDDNSVLASGDQTKRDVYDLTFRGVPRGVTAIRLEVLPDERLPKHGPGRIFYEGPPGDFFLSEFTLSTGGNTVKLARATQTFASGTSNAQAAIDADPQTGWSISGGQGQAHTAVFNLAQPLNADAFTLQLLFERYYAAGLGRFRIAVTTDARPAEAGLPPDVETILLIPANQRTPEQRDRLLKQFLAIAPELKEEREAIQKLRDQRPALPTTLVFQERPAHYPRPTYVRHRGEFLQIRERVMPGVPAVLPPLPKGAKRDRLTFARWLVDPRNPLVGRVTVNRQWAAFFGTGLVKTTEDFGLQGEPPSHPELLDWLAAAFQSKARSRKAKAPGQILDPRPSTFDYSCSWSLKKLHRLIVTSATYRQSSRVTPQLRARDPQNRLLARGPRTRLEAELIRDAALTASGLLSRKIGGPSVFPPQPPGVTTEGAYGPLAWNVSAGEDRYRRGLYTFSKRTTPYAMFMTFDAPSGEACLARREVSNTPLQALTMLNDQVLVEAAQALGNRMAARSGSVEERVIYLFRRCVVRPPQKEEQVLLEKFYAAQKARFENKELDANAIAGPGEGDVNERAAWTTLARSLLNLDEFIMKR